MKHNLISIEHDKWLQLHFISYCLSVSQLLLIIHCLYLPWQIRVLDRQQGFPPSACHPCQSCGSQTPRSSSWTVQPASTAFPCRPSYLSTALWNGIPKSDIYIYIQKFNCENFNMKAAREEINGKPTHSVQWFQDFWRQALNLSWDLESKHLCASIIYLQKVARMNGIDDFPGIC